MRIKLKIGNGPVEVEAWVNIADEKVFCVMWQGVNVLDLLELETLNKITEAAQKKFQEEMAPCQPPAHRACAFSQRPIQGRI